MFHLALVEAALELVPPEILRHPSVRRNAKRRGKRAEETLLNRSLHHSAMDRIPDGHKRGRPDIVNLCLLEALGSPLNRVGSLRVWIHTYGDQLIEVSPQARLPRDCNRFNSLVEQLFAEGSVPPQGEKLMSMTEGSLTDLIGRIEPTKVVALTSRGRESSLEQVCEGLVGEERPLILVGAFPHGPFSESTLTQVTEAVSINTEPLEAGVVTSRLIYEYEKSVERVKRE